MDLSGMGAVVTGGSRGLGAALGRRLAERGVRVALVARDEAALVATVSALRADGLAVHGIAADVGSKEDAHRIAGAAAALVGDVDVLIHNASTLGPTPLPILLDLACEDLSRVLDVNVVGPFRLTKAIAGGMLVRRSGTIVTISSDAAVEAYPGWGAYGLSKAALDHLTRTLAAELADTPLRVFAVDPGEMDTDMHRAALPDADPTTLARPLDVASRIVAMIADDAPGDTRRSAA